MPNSLPFVFPSALLWATLACLGQCPRCEAIPVEHDVSKQFSAGACAVDITPLTERSIIAGGFLEAQSSTIVDRLYARSIVLNDGVTTISLTVVDTCMMTQELIDQAKQIASKQSSIPVDKMMVSATHTHSAPAAMGCLGTRQDKDYAQWLPAKIAESIVAAHERLVPARIGWNSVNDWEHTHNRRWIRKPENKVVDPFGNATGLAHMHPGYLSKDIIGPSGPSDPELSIIAVQQLDGKPIAVLANYSQHYFGAQAISADYYGLFCKYVAEKLNEAGEGNGPFVCAMSQGTSGDLMWMDYGSPAKSLTMASYAESVARYAEHALDSLTYQDFASLAMVEKTIPLQYRVPDAQRLEWARPIAAAIENDLPKNIPEVYAQEALLLHARQTTEVKLQAICIGNLTIATLPNEVYALTGLKLKGRSPYPFHFNIELANGAEGYIPPPEQHSLGGYTTWPARTAGLEVQAEPKIVDTLLEALEQSTQRSRRAMNDEHGPYAQSILDAKPISYWRLNDADGTVARNAVPNGKEAQLASGFAWYLPGVGSGSGIGAEEELTPSRFSGLDQINRAVHLAGGEIVCPLPKVPERFSIALWFWLGERSGASDRSGTLCELPNGEKLVVHQSSQHSVQLGLSGLISEASWPADEWRSVVLVHESGTTRVFVDGSTEPSLHHRASPKSNRDQIVIGNGVQGKIDEVAYFDRALNPSEIESLWAVSGMEPTHRNEISLRRNGNQKASAVSAPEFSEQYTNAIRTLGPILLEPLNVSPLKMQSQGAVGYSGQGYALFHEGRIASTADSVGESYSVSLWFRNEMMNNTRPVTAYLFSRGPDGDPQAPGDHLGIGGTYDASMAGKLIWFNGNARDHVVVGRTEISSKSWNHVVAVRNRNHLQVFLNGDPSPELDVDIDSTVGGSKQFYLGARSDGFAPLQGQLAHFAIFDRALKDSESSMLHSASGLPVGSLQLPTSPTVPSPHSQPLSPERSLAKIHVPEGFRVELVACEPQVIDPVAFDWDERGQLWVVEMSDYPMGMDGQGKAGGRIRVLADRDGDGRYETSQLFAEGLNFPNGILTWRGGVLVTAAPQILFLRDDDGDGQADTKEVLFEGFNEGNQQLRMNGLRWGIDNWVYCANGGHHANHGLGTKIKSNRNGQFYEIGSRDFRFQPDTGALVLESGPSQFGRNRDAWGHWFGTQNAKPLWNYVIADRYLARNPYVPSPNPIQFVLPPNSPEVHPASRPEKRFHSFQEAGHFTSACGGMIYGDVRLFGATEAMHAFTCEPFHNLVQHNIVHDEGVSFTSERPLGENVLDFFASEDRWCRPVMARTGPDGALWIADMYRYMIEHPDWLPPEGKQELLPHYRLGDDRGRIYRVVPIDSKAKEPVKPRAALESSANVWKKLRGDTSSLVSALDSSNDWQRDKAQQMIVWKNDKSAVSRLEALAKSSPRPQTRLQAIATLDGLNALSDSVLVTALRDPNPRVRENAIRWAERRSEVAVQNAALQLASDPDAKVCLQLALTLGEWTGDRTGDALVKLAQRHYDEPFIRSAIMSSALVHSTQFAAGIAKSVAPVAAVFREPIVRQSVESKDVTANGRLLSDALEAKGDEQTTKLDELLFTLQRVGASLDQIAESDPKGNLKILIQELDKVLGRAMRVSQDEQQPIMQRLAAARLLCRTQHRDQAISILGEGLNPQVAPEVQSQVLETLMQSGNDTVVEVLASRWPQLSPTLRTRSLDVWMSRANWTNDLLHRIESQSVNIGSLDLAQRDRLLHYPNEEIVRRATQLLASRNNSTRKEIVDSYRKSLELTADTARGSAVFVRACASCHRRESIGNEVGPNMATVVNHSSEKLLTNIFDPNADIQPGYQAYNLLLTSEEVISGLLSGETANSVTIKQANGMVRTISRREIETLRNSNVSLMPEGLEAVLTPQDVCDLVSFLRKPIAGPE